MLTVSDLQNKLSLKILAGKDGLDKSVNGCYIGDLLSWVMARCDEDNVWITVMGNINAIAVASLKDASCIILSENASLDEDARIKADERKIAVFSSEQNSFELSLKIAKLLNI